MADEAREDSIEAKHDPRTEKARGVMRDVVKKLDPDAPDLDADIEELERGYAGQDYELTAIRELPGGKRLAVSLVRSWGSINDGVLNISVVEYTEDDIPDYARDFTPDLQVKALTYLDPMERSRVFHLGRGDICTTHGPWDKVEDDAGLLDVVITELGNDWEVVKRGTEPTGVLRMAAAPSGE